MYTTSKLVLGDPWKKLSPQQRKAYITEFKQYLANRYGGHIGGYDQETVDFLTVRKEPRGQATVRTRIVGGKFEGTRVDYRMREKDGQWFMIDVTIENSSMISILKDECKEMLRRGGPDHLIQKLREKNALGPVED